MKRKIFAVMWAVVLAMICGIVGMAEEQPEVDGDIRFEVGEQVFDFLRYDVATDYEGNLAIILSFDYTNNSEEAKMAAYDFYVQVFQGGIEKDSCVIDYDSQWREWDKNLTTEIKDGVTFTVCRAFLLNDTQSPVEVEVSEFVNWSDTQKMKIDISKYTGEMPEAKTEAGEVNTYESEYTEMSENYALLQSEHEALQSEYDALLEKYNVLLESQSGDVEETGHDEEDEAGVGNASTEEMLQSELGGIEKNTNDALNKVIEIAKNNASIATDEQISEAISAIRDNHPQYYNGPEQMELYMYYGYLLDFAFDDSDPRSELGMDTYQAIKYVYRGSETVLDSATKANLDQIEKDLQKIN